ncbi:MAG: patatin-like phospholipase family protein [Rhodocyclaceae bacterium]|nr:patatin-like phospholipase family protein [Rhodocyclaceae bacterium]
MAPRHIFAHAAVVLASLLLSACATRPVNPPITAVPDDKPYNFERTGKTERQKKNLVVLSFSGGGTRAAAFSYGVLEALKRTEIINTAGEKFRLLDEVDAITGVSGGSFTALSYRLYGDKLFDEYESRFLKRDVQGGLIWRGLNPFNWPALASTGWGRSEMAADYYDEILFNGVTFNDLDRKDGPFVAVSATDITSGSRVLFTPTNFDIICSELGSFRVARAAAASSAVPVVLSPLTINNYGGTCTHNLPTWTQPFLSDDNPPRPAARALERIRELRELQSGQEPYLHLVDGAVSDNLGLRGVLDIVNMLEALKEAGYKTSLDQIERMVVIVVNATSTPKTDWAHKEDAPSTLSIMVKASGVPIDRYSMEQIDLLRDTESRWRMMRILKDNPTIKGVPRNSKNPAIQYVRNSPDVKLYTINVSFAGIPDAQERAYLNQLPTTFVLEDEAVDRLRTGAQAALWNSPDFQMLIKDTGARMIELPTQDKTGASN